MELMSVGEKQLRFEDPHFKIGECWLLRDTVRETFPRVHEKRTKTSEDQRTKEGDGTNM